MRMKRATHLVRLRQRWMVGPHFGQFLGRYEAAEDATAAKDGLERFQQVRLSKLLRQTRQEDLANSRVDAIRGDEQVALRLLTATKLEVDALRRGVVVRVALKAVREVHLDARRDILEEYILDVGAMHQEHLAWGHMSARLCEGQACSQTHLTDPKTPLEK